MEQLSNYQISLLKEAIDNYCETLSTFGEFDDRERKIVELQKAYLILNKSSNIKNDSNWVICDY